MQPAPMVSLEWWAKLAIEFPSFDFKIEIYRIEIQKAFITWVGSLELKRVSWPPTNHSRSHTIMMEFM